MTKKFEGIWCKNLVLCPKCLVPPGRIRGYGADQQGFWFKAGCPHCGAIVKWYRKPDLSVPEASRAEGVQMSLFSETEIPSANKHRAKGNRQKGK